MAATLDRTTSLSPLAPETQRCAAIVQPLRSLSLPMILELIGPFARRLMLGVVLAASPKTPVVAKIEPKPLDTIDAIGWFVGGTWITEEKQPDGTSLTVRLRCRWSGTRRAILYDLDFLSRGTATPQYDGVYYYDPDKRTIVSWQVNRTREIAHGVLTGTPNDLRQETRVSHPDGTEHFLQSRIER